MEKAFSDSKEQEREELAKAFEEQRDRSRSEIGRDEF